MDQNGYLSASERLSMFLDGELEAADASSLFYELAQSPELQEEMQQHIGVRKMYGDSYVHPPAHLKSNIMSGIGLGAAAGTAAYASGGFLSALLGSKGFLMFASAVVAALTTVLVMTNVQDNRQPFASEELNSGSPSLAINNEPSGDFMRMTYPVVESVEKNSRAERQDISRSGFIPVFVPVAEHSLSGTDFVFADGLTDESAAVNNKQSRDYSEYLSNDITSSALYATNFERPGNFILASEYLPGEAKYEPPKDETSKYSIQLRGFKARSIPEFELEPLANPAFNDIALGLFYHMDDSHSFGVEIGQENIYQEYSGMITADNEIRYEQNYMAFWAGASYQYVVNTGQDVNLNPFVRVFAGGTNVGPIGRGIIGLDYRLNDKIGLYTGLEGSILIYRYGGNIFTTQKLGVTYGVRVKF